MVEVVFAASAHIPATSRHTHLLHNLPWMTNQYVGEKFGGLHKLSKLTFPANCLAKFANIRVFHIFVTKSDGVLLGATGSELRPSVSSAAK